MTDAAASTIVYSIRSSPIQSYIRLPQPVKSYILRFNFNDYPGSNLIFHTNYQPRQAVIPGSHLPRPVFDRLDYVATTIPPSTLNKPFHVDLLINKAGAFSYYVSYSTRTSSHEVSSTGYFSIDPLLSIPTRSSILSSSSFSLSAPTQIVSPSEEGIISKEPVVLPLNGLVIQTVVGKWMGTIEQWESDGHLALMSERGYNMLHYTPLQVRGESGSPYSIRNQLEFDDSLFEARVVTNGVKSNGNHSGSWSRAEKEQKMKECFKMIKERYGILGMIDVVLNHTSNDSEWLNHHPEAGYSPQNTPHLISGLVLDNALQSFSTPINLKSVGLSTHITTVADLDRLMSYIADTLIPSLKLYEFYVLNREAEIEEFTTAWTSHGHTNGHVNGNGTVNDDGMAEQFIRKCLPADWSQFALADRFASKIDIAEAVSFVSGHISSSDLEQAISLFASLIDLVNLPRYKLYDDDVVAILENTRSRIRFMRLDSDGPLMGEITPSSPLLPAYFTHLSPSTLHPASALSLANNGWIWSADPLHDFASTRTSRTYIRRELIVWSDCVKLRYGDSAADSPFLWNHMSQYVRSAAKLFEGFRLDNCHSTPLAVGEHMMDQAREERNDLWICAELFTGSKEVDEVFVKKLGINSLIREALNANDPKDQSRLLYDYGLGRSIGSVSLSSSASSSSSPTPSGHVHLSLPPSAFEPHAFLMDVTHDNPSPASKRTAIDALSTGALVAIAGCAVGSNRGFDDLFAKGLDLVDEKRHYDVPRSMSSRSKPPNVENLSQGEGIGQIKRILNHLHTELALTGFDEGFFSDQGNYVTGHRVNPLTGRGFLLIAHTAFSSDRPFVPLEKVSLPSTSINYLFGTTLTLSAPVVDPSTSTHIIGFKSTLLPILESSLDLFNSPERSTISVRDGARAFPPGSVMLFETQIQGIPIDLQRQLEDGAGARKAWNEIGMVELNAMLFRSNGEEIDALGDNSGSYVVPNLGHLVYCGLHGWKHRLDRVVEQNDLGHPLSEHLRNGSWALDYIWQRLEKQLDRFPLLAPATSFLRSRLELIKDHVPSFLRPKYFAQLISTAYTASVDRMISLSSAFIQQNHDSPFIISLALTSLQMYGRVSSATLTPQSITTSGGALAAGLPHFEAGWARTWGRDVFISVRGLFLVTGQEAAAQEHILAFASVLKHGLIPNLLDSGRTPRYNSRDSPWWFLQSIQDYTVFTRSLALLDETVLRRFPLDDTWIPYDSPEAYTVSTSIADVIQEIMQRHANGIKFREYNAGSVLDSQMRDEGFNIDISVDWKTGVIEGGNQWNCGTWMDKMGESEKAGNKGHPSTSRHGAPVEITGLLKSTLRWLTDLSKKKQYPYAGVNAIIEGKERFVTYAEWNELLEKSFERLYHIPTDPSLDSTHSLTPSLIARRGIYKDVFAALSNDRREAYQLRCNFPVAMTVAPELFDPVHALAALKIMEKRLVSKLGVKTLDPDDECYRGDYDNSNDSDDKSIAKGANYHQGPEWVFPIGFFLRAYLHFDLLVGEGKSNPQTTYEHIHSTLVQHREHIARDAWAGLPELTNQGGRKCYDSCDTQAWSSSTILDVLEEIDRRSSS